MSLFFGARIVVVAVDAVVPVGLIGVGVALFGVGVGVALTFVVGGGGTIHCTF